MKRSILLAQVCLLALPLAAIAAEQAEPVSIALPAEARVSGPIVRLGALCDLRGGSELLRRRIAALDVAELDADQPVELTRSQLCIRLALADIAPDRFRLVGSPRVRIVPNDAIIGKAAIQNAIKQQLAKQCVVTERDLELRFLQDVEPVVVRNARPEQVRLEADVPLQAALGTLRAQVRVYVDGQLRETLGVPVDAAMYVQVARARTRIDLGDQFTLENVTTERHRLRSRVGIAEADEVIGRYARHAIRTGTVIGEHDLDGEASAHGPVLVKPQDTVRLVAQKGKLTVVVNAAEALQQGRQGDMIRVRNLTSKKVVVGRVVAESEVRVAF